MTGPLISMMFLPPCLIGADLDYADILQCSSLSVADETHRFQSAGKVRAVQSITRFEDIQHIGDPAGLSRVSEIDFNAVKKGFLRQKRDQFLAIDP